MIRSTWLACAGGLALTALGVSACNNGASFTGPGQTGGTPISISQRHPNWTGATLTNSPAPISGGTLLVTRDGRTAVAADPDRDTVTVVNVAERRVVGQVALQAGDEPGRAVEDAAGRVHVVLRAGGGIATIDVAGAQLASRRAVCAAPRGIAYQAAGDALHVACADGRLVTLPAAGGDPTRTLDLGLDLRDVVVDGDRLVVTRFRTAEIVTVDAAGAIHQSRAQRLTMEWGEGSVAPDGTRPANVEWDPNVAWRTVPLPRGGGVAMVHQRGLHTPLPPAPAYYGPQPSGGFCNEAVAHGTVTIVRRGGQPTRGPTIAEAVLPVDVAISPDERRMVVVAAGNAALARDMGGEADPQVQEFDLAGFETDVQEHLDHWCARPARLAQPTGQATAAAFTPDGQLLVQTREPAALFFVSDRSTLTLPGPSRQDLGHEIFHNSAGGRIACASCHPEGRDDGHVWSFDVGKRRTQNLALGNVTRSPRLHWEGDLGSFEQLGQMVFTGRMNGGQLNGVQSSALATWLDRLRAMPPARPAPDMAAVTRGREVFTQPTSRNPTGRCSQCHSGERLTNDQVMAVGTLSMPSDPTAGAFGRTPLGPRTQFKVPSLRGVAWRAPFMHDGCAATLRDRLTGQASCTGGDAHGQTSDLSPAQIDDLIAYMETL